MDGISFLSPMVSAIVDGKKTVTRRPLKTQPTKEFNNSFGVIKSEAWFCDLTKEQTNIGCAGKYFTIKNPYGKVGDTLYVRQPWKVCKTNLGAGIYFEDDVFCIHSKAKELLNGNNTPTKWRSAKSLPKWASRVQIKITELKVERLHDITDSEVRKEGTYLDYLEPSNLLHADNCSRTELFMLYWDLCYRESFPWGSNPWVWVLDFKLIS